MSATDRVEEPETGDSLFSPRRRDRRQTVADLVTGISRSLVQREDIAFVRSAFEEAVAKAVPVQSVQLLDGRRRWMSRPEARPAESIALEVPGWEPEGAGVLEATFAPGAPLGEWDFQILGIAAHVGALVMAVERAHLQLARAGLLPDRVQRESAAPLIGTAPQMAELRETIGRVAATDFTVLVEGESGVGKELVARQIHDLSRRRSGPFVAINCAALVETLLEAELFGIEERTATGVRGRRGKFENADGGTLFLDEVSDLSPAAQAKLLRAIQDLAVERVGGNGTHRVDIRIVAATNRPLHAAVRDRTFRPDLYYRLSGVDIRVPPLRERRSDILDLAKFFLSRHRTGRRLTLSPEAADALIYHDWPGNVRELERLIERVVALASSEVIGLDDLPPLVGGRHLAALEPSLTMGETLKTWARRYARVVLERHGGNRRNAARALGISYHTLKAYLRLTPEETADGVWDQEKRETGSTVGATGAA